MTVTCGQAGQHVKPVTITRVSTSNRSDRDGQLQLFTLPFSGGSPDSFCWLRALPPDVLAQLDLLSASLNRPILDDPGDHSPSDVRQIVRCLVREFASRLSGPYVLFGHSMGALLGYELAQALRISGLPAPARFIVSGFRAPNRPSRLPPVHDRSDAEILNRLSELGGTPDEVLDHPELMALVAERVRVDLEMCETHAWEGGDPLSCPLTALCGTLDPQASVEDVHAWHQWTRSTFSFWIFKGRHFFFKEDPQSVLHALAVELREVIQTETQRTAGGAPRSRPIVEQEQRTR